MRQLVDYDRQRNEVAIKLEEALETEQLIPEYGIRADSKLKVHIVDADNLPPGIQAYVNVSQDFCSSDTGAQEGPGPIWNTAIVFDINNPTKELKVDLFYKGSDQPVIHEDIDLRVNQRGLNQHLEEGNMNPDASFDLVTSYKNMGQDIWLFAYKGPDRDEGPKLRIRLHYNYSDVEKYSSLDEEWRLNIVEELKVLSFYDEFKETMEKPFDFFVQQH